MSFGASTPVFPHTMLVERVDIEEPTAEILQATSTAPVSCPKNVRTTIFTKEITVPVGKTEVFIAAYVANDPLDMILFTTYFAIDGVDFASQTMNNNSGILSKWTTLSAGVHTFTIDRLYPNNDGYGSRLYGSNSCVMVCRESGSKYVCFGAEEITVLTKPLLSKIIVGVRGLSIYWAGFHADGYAEVTDGFGNTISESLFGACPTNPILHEFVFLDGATLKIGSGSSWGGFWISYLILVYEV